ncbi:MAG TPA: hypothetical protein VN643_07495 [Pyrinomonadaceae bacterium]|nr:hypothetical protein [Pyrinomonadaceae bacterium]
MKAVLLLSLLLSLAVPIQSFQTRGDDHTTPANAAVTQSPTVAPGGSLVEVVEHKCVKSKQELLDPPYTADVPARAVIPQNKNYARNARVNDPVGARDPNEDTIDGRSAALEKISQEARHPKSKPVDGYSYKVKVQNASNRTVEILFIEYQFVDAANPKTAARRQFLCGVNIKPNKNKELSAFGLSGPPEVVSVGTLANNSQFQEKVIINRVEYSDGTIWQRKDWNFAEIGMSYRRVTSTPWGNEMCRGL